MADYSSILSGILHWLESWIAHDMAFRLLSVMRINVFKKLDLLAPAYLVRRRTGDLMGLPHMMLNWLNISSPTVLRFLYQPFIPAAVVVILSQPVSG
ncbi:MAG: hypothetical protein CM1200mP30_08760 [Pseudomonadota bacterium]|nr:MAG: hypothetical protein CM1200mP30_08760 [Pseudomonadota bacterium]